MLQASAMSILNQLPYSKKFTLIGFLLLMPFAYTTFVMYDNVGRQEIFNQKESYGVQFVAAGYQFLLALQESRTCSAETFSESESDVRKARLSLDRAMARAGSAIGAIDALDIEYKFNFSAADGTLPCSLQWSKLRGTWEKIKENPPRSLDASNKVYSDMCAATIDWIISYVANYSNLILDPDLDSYWLMDAFVIRIPQLSECLSRTQLFTKSKKTGGAIMQQNSNGFYLELAMLYGDSVRVLNALENVNFKSAFDYNTMAGRTLKNRMNPGVQNVFAKCYDFLAVLHTRLLSETPKVFSPKIGITASESIDSLISLHLAIGPELDALILDRVKTYRRDKLAGASTAFIATFLFILVLFALYKSIAHSVEQLREYTGRMLTGTNKIFELNSHDEFAEIAHMYNTINCELNLTRNLRNDSEFLREQAESSAQALRKEIAARETAQQQREIMQTQLSEAKKLESVGQLAAGIAHEINTPIQYVGDNTRFLQDAFKDLSKVIACHRSLARDAAAGAVAPDAITRAEQAVRDVDLEYLEEEVPRAIEQALDGVSRVTNIVSAMKEFSHPGTKGKVATDINRAIKTTVTVARNEWKYVADLTMDMDADLPSIPCLPGEFNQVILNLVINAAHAIGDVVKASGSKGAIGISTRREDDTCTIRISDSGTGIPESARTRIFDPFFTTKEVGKGTGQGLAIARNIIVSKHSGSIHFETEIGKGTTFIIKLPLSSGVVVEGCA